MKGYELMEWALGADVSDPPRARQTAADGRIIERGDRGLRPCRRAVLLSYARHVNRKTGLAWLAIETLERETQFERKSILPARVELVMRGLLIPAGRLGRSGLPKFRLGCPEHGIPETVNNRAQKSRQRDSACAAEIPPLETRNPKNGTERNPKNGIQNPGVEPSHEPERSRAHGAPLTGWRPTETDLAAARHARPELTPVLDTIVAKFTERYRGTRRAEAKWRSLFMRWIHTERCPEVGDGSAWWKSEKATVRKGTELGLRATRGEGFEEFRDRIRARLAAAEREAA